MKNLILSVMIGMIAIIIIFTIGIYIYFLKVEIQPQQEYRDKKREEKRLKHIEARRLEEIAIEKETRGYKLFHAHGCNGCHAIENTSLLLGPSLNGIMDKKSESYIKDALEYPNKDLALGFDKNIMPTFNFTPEERKDLFAYMKLYK